jgi:hypothetical protein
MPCSPETLKHVPLFALLDDEETAVLAGQVEVKKFAPRQRIYKIGDPGGRAYVMVSGRVRITTVDQDHQEVIVDEPSYGEFFGFASMLDQTPHQTDAIAVEETICLEVDRHDISVLLDASPWPEWTCFPCSGNSFMPHSSWSESGQIVTRTRLSKRMPPSARGSPIPLLASAARGRSSSLSQ